MGRHVCVRDGVLTDETRDDLDDDQDQLDREDAAVRLAQLEAVIIEEEEAEALVKECAQLLRQAKQKLRAIVRRKREIAFLNRKRRGTNHGRK